MPFVIDDIAVEAAEVGSEIGELAEKVGPALEDEIKKEFSPDKFQNNETPLSSEPNGDVSPKVFDNTERIRTRNESLSGTCHPETGVPFTEKVIIDATGEQRIGVFPIFESVIDVQLPEGLLQASDSAQFSECNILLKDAVHKDINLRNKFSPDQLADIEDGITPEGYSWHHSEDIGKMQLVDYNTHAATGHTGGKSIWGGGADNR